MIFIATASFPQTSVKNAARIYGEMKKLPAAIRRHGPYFKVESGQDIKMIAVYETDSAASQEVKKFLEKRYEAFEGVAGFSARVEPWANLPDAVAQLAKTPAGNSA